MSRFGLVTILKSIAERAEVKNTLLKTLPSLNVLLLCAAAPAFAQDSSATTGHDYQFCRGYYALCAASTCTPTGKSITVNVTSGGTAQFPEVELHLPGLFG